jgi:hypothetical protein
LKASFTTTPFFIHANPSKPFVLEVDASNFALGGVLSQFKEDNLFDPISFCFHEIKYEIHKNELLAIMDDFEEWCQLFEGVQHEITMYYNHKNLQYFMTVYVLN